MDTQHDYSYEDRAEDIRHLFEHGGSTIMYRGSYLGPCSCDMADILDAWENENLPKLISWEKAEKWINSGFSVKTKLRGIKRLGSDVQADWDDFLDNFCLILAQSERR